MRSAEYGGRRPVTKTLRYSPILKIAFWSCYPQSRPASRKLDWEMLLNLLADIGHERFGAPIVVQELLLQGRVLEIQGIPVRAFRFQVKANKNDSK
jgi:hypothetical protein